MKSELDHAIWMLEHQINSPYELIALWMLFETPSGPSIETFSPWYQDLEVEIV